MDISTQKEIRDVRKFSFCYICGKPFEPTDKQNDDHVPPTSIFIKADRNFPLILRTHKSCNSDRSCEDQLIGQLIGFLHGQRPNEHHNKLNFQVVKGGDGQPSLLLKESRMKELVWRWIRGFHAALYKEPLPEKSRQHICLPMPELNPIGCQTGNVQEAIPHFIEAIKRNRLTKTLDRIECRNGKCRYECVWDKADDGSSICIFALDLYNWITLGDSDKFEQRGCRYI